jgi:lipopolysaccharide transport system ATP-binding protein
LSNYAISVQGLSKQYVIGGQERGYRTFREMLLTGLAAPLNRLRKLGDNAKKEERFWALKDVSFDLEPGEIVGIIGRNGAGKSTLLKILSRITAPTEGRVKIKGRVGSLLEVGTGFHPELTGRENIFLNGAILGMSKTDVHRKFDEIVSFAEVEKFLDTPVKRYSSGMYVRLAFAVAAHLESDILIVDEVLAVGDAEFQRKCLGKMHDVGKIGRAILFVSHNLGAVRSLCGKALLIDAGSLKEIGPAENVLQKYMTSIRETDVEGKPGCRSLDSRLLLHELSFRPRDVSCMETINYRLALSALESTRVREIAIIFMSSAGERVAIIDLREAGFAEVSVDSKGITVEGIIKSIPLVEDEYRIGLYIASEHGRNDYPDLQTINVFSPKRRIDFVPYAAAYRGRIELEFTANVMLG